MALKPEKAFEAIKKSIDQSKVKKIESIEGKFTSPDKVSFGGYNSKQFQPDVEAHYEDRTDIYAIVPRLTKAAVSEDLKKWILFSLEAKKKNGTLYLVVEKAHKDQLQELITSKKIHAEVFPVAK